VRLGVVVQRYGTEVNGGAELHARYIAELLARHHDVEVFTTCARDYVTWRDEYPPGAEAIGRVTVSRFPVARERDPEDFGRRSRSVFEQVHSVADELAWLESEGPTSPALIDAVSARRDEFDFFIFFSYRYYHAWHGIRRLADRAILVPTAERDAAIGVSIFGQIFRRVRGLMYNSPEERAMIQAVSGNGDVPGVVVGVGSRLPAGSSPERFRQKYGIEHPFVVYVGRIDENKGCRELFHYFTNYRPRFGQRLSLVLIGTSLLPIPDDPRIVHLGFVSDQDKFDAIAAAQALIMPSYFESLSMVALEAWGLGRPVLANGRCDVLRGQCIRSRAALYYESFEEFSETLFTLTMKPQLNAALGENGRRFYQQHYDWPVIERKYQDMLWRLKEAPPDHSASPERLPGWITGRRKTLPPAASVVAELPSGPVLANVAPPRDEPDHRLASRTTGPQHAPESREVASASSERPRPRGGPARAGAPMPPRGGRSRRPPGRR
jgi:glycosyltransferase involved in cell wall biosynthesis